MKIESTNSRIRKFLTSALVALASAALLAIPSQATAAKPFIFNINGTFEDPDSFCVPVQMHIQGRIIEQGLFSGEELTLIESFKLDFTNLNTGKTVTTRTAVRIKDTYVGEWGLIEEIEGVILIRNGRDTWVSAGFTMTIVFDPITGEELYLTVKSTGRQDGDFNEALCAALQ